MEKKTDIIGKQIVEAILSGTYTPFDLREFIQLCYDLAIPIIRKKIGLGKLILSSVDLKETDVVYDCIADIFQRDENGDFTEIRTFFDKQLGDQGDRSEEKLVATLRYLIFAKINNNIVRLYSDADPALGKILRNLKLELKRSDSFEEITRFGDVYLVPKGIDPLFHLAPMSIDIVKETFCSVVLVHDTIPKMVAKLHAVIIEQNEFQRAVSFVSVAVLFKEIYSLGWETEREINVVEEKLEIDDLQKIVEDICCCLRNEMYPSYVGNGKCSEDIFEKYMGAVKNILQSTFVDKHLDGSTYCEYLQSQIPGLTKEEYLREHRTILEYLAKSGKERLKSQFKEL